MHVPVLACGKKRILDSNFDSGSSSSITFVDPLTVRITPIKHWSNTWAWVAVRTNRFGSKIPHFLVAKANHYNIAAGEWLVCWSNALDTDTWHAFDNVSVGASDIEFYNDTPFPSGMIFICSLPAYPFSRVQRRVAELSLSGYASDTISSSAYVLGYSSSRDANDGTGKISPVLPFLAMKITNPNANTKNNVLLLTGNHPSETSGRYALLEGAVSWLVGSTPQAKFFRDWCSVFLYPGLNPQGIYSGYFRSSPQTKDSDNNRIWDESGNNEAIDAFNTAFAADTGGDVEVALDFHSWMDAWACKGYTVDPADALHVVFANKLAVLEPDYVLAESTAADTLANILHTTYSTQLSITQECGGITTRQVPEWKLYGQYTMQVLAEMLAEGRFNHGPGVGSRDFNGTTDRIDFASPWTPTGQPITISAQVNLDVINKDQYLVNLSIAGGVGIHLSQMGVTTGAGTIQFSRKGATSLLRYSANGVIEAGEPFNIIATHDGVFTTYSSVHLYKDGVEISYGASPVNGVTESDVSGIWNIGARSSDDLRNTNGKLSQIRIFNVVLTPAEIALESAGIYTTIRGLVFWWKGNTDSLVDVVGSVEGTADGTTQLTGVGNGPTIYYP